MHNRGVKHRDLSRTVAYGWLEGWRDYWAWAKDYPIRPKELKPKRVVDVQEVRYERALKAEKRWLTKLKRAQTALKKIVRQKKYYERKMAAAHEPKKD